MGGNLKNSIYLITGGTGSFGHAMAQRLLDEGAKEVRIFSRDEKKQEDMRIEFSDSRLSFYIGDVRDANSLKGAMSGVEYVFQAAALKQVPACDFFPWEATLTNVLGVKNVLDLAIEAKVKKVVCLSTDKAVYPINAMGITKALMEKVSVAKALECRKNGGPVICVTRYGNVMASRGSVIPHFARGMRSDQTIEITNPSMTRFMMTLDDAVDLVLYAFEFGGHGDILVQKAPATSIGNLVEAMKVSLGKPDSQSVVIGTRHGEKMHESLLSSEESERAEDLGGYFRVYPDDRDLNYSDTNRNGAQQVFSPKGVPGFASNTAKSLDVEEMLALLSKIAF